MFLFGFAESAAPSLLPGQKRGTGNSWHLPAMRSHPGHGLSDLSLHKGAQGHPDATAAGAQALGKNKAGFWLSQCCWAGCAAGQGQACALLSLQFPFQSHFSRESPLPFPASKGAATHQEQLPDRGDMGDTDTLGDTLTLLCNIKEILCNGLLEGRSFGNVSTSSLRDPLNLQPYRSSSPFWGLKLNYSCFSLHQQNQNWTCVLLPKDTGAFSIF